MRGSLNAEKIANREVSAWTTGLALMSDAAWIKKKNTSGRHKYAKRIKWPYRESSISLTAFANRQGLLQKIQPETFVLGRLSGIDVETDLHQYSQYWVVRGGLYRVLHRHTKLISEMTSEEQKEWDESFHSLIESPIALPNNEDREELVKMLYIGYMDGVRPYVFSE